MNLGQMMMVIGALAILGILVLNANRTVVETNETQNVSEFGINAVSLATSLVEEANGKMYDEVISDTLVGVLTNPSQLTMVGSLGHEGESYRDSVNDFDDFDDFDGLFLVFKSPLDSAVTTGAHREVIVPGIRATYHVKASVTYVEDTNLDAAGNHRTWHKLMTVTVTSPSIPDTLRYPSLMSYWN